jgi:hypothetical protein
MFFKVILPDECVSIFCLKYGIMMSEVICGIDDRIAVLLSLEGSFNLIFFEKMIRNCIHDGFELLSLGY